MLKHSLYTQVAVEETWLSGSLNILSDVAGWHWIITYSGGKDSTSVTILAVETFRRWTHLAPQRLDIVYSDTLVEIPPMHEQALDFLNHVQRLGGENAWLSMFIGLLHPLNSVSGT